MTVYAVGKFDWQREILALDLPAVTKLTAMALSVYADKDGSSCHPGLENLARAVGLSPRRVAGHLRVLRDLGLVNLVSSGGGRGRRLADEYQLSWSDYTANALDNLAKQRTSKRPENTRETTDAITSDESPDTTDVCANTTDVSRETTDVESDTTDAAMSPHQVVTHQPDTSGVSSPCGDSIAAPASPSTHDNDDDYQSARCALASLAPVVMEQLLDDSIKDIGADDMRAVVIHAAELFNTKTAVAS